MDNLIKRDIKDVLFDNYLPYCAKVITDRAIPEIDGLKPSQRKIMFAAFKENATENAKTKCANVVGATMKFHPHGDRAIYDTLTKMTDKYNLWTVPPIAGRGNLGKTYSDASPAASRYTECGISNIAKKYYFDFMDAVKYVPTYDNRDTEPELLPVAFPSILAEVTEGVAVGYSTSIPSFNLIDLLTQTKNMLIEGISGFDYTAIRPNFRTGGFAYYGIDIAHNIWRNGKGAIPIYCNYRIEGNNIVITELPYGTTVEKVVTEINSLKKRNEWVRSRIGIVREDTGLHGMELTIQCYYDTENVLHALWSKTSLKTNFNALIQIIHKGKLKKNLSAFHLLKLWCDWRKEVVSNHFNNLFEKEDSINRKLKAYLEFIEKVDAKEWFNKLLTESDYAITRYLKEVMTEVEVTDEIIDFLMNLKLLEFKAEALRKNKKRYEESIQLLEKYSKYGSNPEIYIVEEIDKMIPELQSSGYKQYTELFDEMPDEFEFERREKTEYVDTSPCKVHISEDMILQKVTPRAKTPETSVITIEGCRADSVLLVFSTTGEILKIYLEDIEFASGKQGQIYIPEYFGLDDLDILDIKILESNKTFVVVHKFGEVGFVPASNFVSDRKTKVVKNGFACDGTVVDILVADSAELDSLYLNANSLLKRKASVKVGQILKKSRVAKTSVFNAKYDVIVSVSLGNEPICPVSTTPTKVILK